MHTVLIQSDQQKSKLEKQSDQIYKLNQHLKGRQFQQLSQGITRVYSQLNQEVMGQKQQVDEEQCLSLILQPEFVDNLGVLKQGSGSTIATSMRGGTNDSLTNSQQENKENKNSENTMKQSADKIHQAKSPVFKNGQQQVTSAEILGDSNPKCEKRSIFATIKPSSFGSTKSLKMYDLQLPEFNGKIDYQHEYHKVFHENERMLQQYDRLILERENDLKLYRAMKNGDFSHIDSGNQSQGLLLAHQSTSEICKQLIPQLVKHKIAPGDEYQVLNNGKRILQNPRRNDQSLDNFSVDEHNQSEKIRRFDNQSLNEQQKQQQDQRMMTVTPKNGVNTKRLNNVQQKFDEIFRENQTLTEGQMLSESEMIDVSVENCETSKDKLVNNLLQNINNNHPALSSNISNRPNGGQRKKHVRRCAKELSKSFPCLYRCGKVYATDAARNMHMRDKHNEVTKTERDRKAREIIRTCGLKNNTEIINKLSQLTQVQQDQLQNELLVQTIGMNYQQKNAIE